MPSIVQLDHYLHDLYTKEATVKQNVVMLWMRIVDSMTDMLRIQAIRYSDCSALDFDS